MHPAVAEVVRQVAIDDGHRHVLGVHRAHHLLPEAAVPAQDPGPPWWVAVALDGGAGQAGEPVGKLPCGRRVQRQREHLGELLERVDDVARTERGHRRRRLDALRAAQHRDLRRQQARGDRHRQVAGVVVGERDHAHAVRMRQPGKLEDLRVARVGVDRRHVGRIALQLDLAHLRFVQLDHHRAVAQAVQRVAHQASGLTVAADEVEGLAQPPHRAREALDGEGLLQVAVGQQREHAAQRVSPADHRQVDADRHPQPLLVGEGVGNLAETDRGGGVADEVEGMEEAQVLNLAFRIDAWRQSEAQHRHCHDHDEQDQRRAHAPQDQEEDALVPRQRIHRRHAWAPVAGLRMRAFSGAA